MSGILLTAEFTSSRMKSNKVSVWNLYQSDVKEDIPVHIRRPAKTDGSRPKFTGDYANAVTQQWPDKKAEYMEKAHVINEASEMLTAVPMVLHQKRMLTKLKEQVCHCRVRY